MSHTFEPVPHDEDGRILDCYLDGPAAVWRVGCSCGWEGPEIPLPATHFTLPDAVYDEVEAAWETLHYVDAVLGERESQDDLVISLPETTPATLDMTEFERMLALS